MCVCVIVARLKCQQGGRREREGMTKAVYNFGKAVISKGVRRVSCVSVKVYVYLIMYVFKYVGKCV